MVASATVRVRSPSAPEGQRPDREQLERTAELLREGGFDVVRIGRFGVNVLADEAVFALVLGVDLNKPGPIVEPARPHDAELSRLVDFVEVAGSPTLFPTS